MTGPLPSRELLTTPMSFVDPSACGRSPTEGLNNICTKGTTGGGICHGDSGSALVSSSNNQAVIVGILSGGYNPAMDDMCLPSGTPTVYGSVAAIRPWIVPSLLEVFASQGILTLKIGPNFKPSVRIEIKFTGGLGLSERVFDVSQTNGWTAQTKIVAYTGYLDDSIALIIGLNNGAIEQQQEARIKL